MVVGGRLGVEGDDEKSRGKREPEEQEGETRDSRLGDVWSGSKGRWRAVEIDLKHLNDFVHCSAPIPKIKYIESRCDTDPS